jgi:hypothetical protein
MSFQKNAPDENDVNNAGSAQDDQVVMQAVS